MILNPNFFKAFKISSALNIGWFIIKAHFLNADKFILDDWLFFDAHPNFRHLCLKLFREIYGDRENSHSFLTNNLPGKILYLVSMSTLMVSKDSFIEKEPADYYSDILYRVMLKDGSAGRYVNAK